MPVVQLIRMDHQGVAASAVGLRAAVSEQLDAAQRVTDGIAIVAVRIVGVPGEKGLEPLEHRLGRRAPQPVLR